MRHRYECPLRWADLDLLGHVNNVVYVDYLQEARVAMMRPPTYGPQAAGPSGGLPDAMVVVRSEVTYRAPLGFRSRPVTIETWVTRIRAASFTLGYEIFDERDGERVVYLRARTDLAPYVFDASRPRRLTADERAALQRYVELDEPVGPTPGAASGRRAEELPASAHRYPVQVRFSDVDVYGHVNNVKYFEYFQEARISMMSELLARHGHPSQVGHLVVAQMDVDYRAPLVLRPEPYDLRSGVVGVGRTSITIASEILDQDSVQAAGRAVVVFWDPATGRPAEPAAEVRAVLEEPAGSATPAR